MAFFWGFDRLNVFILSVRLTLKSRGRDFPGTFRRVLALWTALTTGSARLNDRVWPPAFDTFTVGKALHAFPPQKKKKKAARADLCNSITAHTDLVVHLQRLALSFGVEVLRVGVHREVNLPVEALHVNRVPVLVVQQAAHRDGDAAAAAAEPLPVIVCGSSRKKKKKQKGGEKKIK